MLMLKMLIENELLIKIAMAFFVGGFAVTLLTAVVDRLGPTLGGTMSGIPSNATASLIFIGLTLGLDESIVAADSAYVGFAAALIFMVAYLKLRRHVAAIGSYVLALCTWFIYVYIASTLNIDTIWESMLLLLLTIMISHPLLSRLPTTKSRKQRVSIKNYAVRYGMSGGIIALTVLIANSVNPTWGGYFAGFPAAFTGLIIILEGSNGIKHLNSVMKHSAVGMLASIVFFAAFHWFAEQANNVWLAVIGSYAVSIPFAYLIYRLRTT